MNPKERFNLMKWGSFNEHRAAIIEACGQPAASIGETSYDLITDIMEAASRLVTGRGLRVA
jgi:hypothetical protein